MFRVKQSSEFVFHRQPAGIFNSVESQIPPPNKLHVLKNVLNAPHFVAAQGYSKKSNLEAVKVMNPVSDPQHVVPSTQPLGDNDLVFTCGPS